MDLSVFLASLIVFGLLGAARTIAARRPPPEQLEVRVRSSRWALACVGFGVLAAVLSLFACAVSVVQTRHVGGMLFTVVILSGTLYLIRLGREMLRMDCIVSRTGVVLPDGTVEPWSSLSKVRCRSATSIEVRFASGRVLEFHDYMIGWGFLCTTFAAQCTSPVIDPDDLVLVNRIVAECVR